MSIAIIANPIAGRGRGEKIAHLVEQILAEQNVDFELTFTKYHKHAIELAAEASIKHEVVVALGGDGTIRQVLEGIWQTSSVLGVIPGGTGNDYARGLQIPLKTKQALQVLLGQHTAPLDVGLAGEETFGVLASIGFPVDVIEYVNVHREGIFKGPLAIIGGVISTIRHLKTHPLKITIDGNIFEKEVAGLLIMNMPYAGGGLKFTPDAHYNDGVFSVLILESISKLDLALTLPKAYSGKHIPHPAITILTGREVSLEGDPLSVMLDGDIFAMDNLQTKIIPSASKVIVAKAPIF